jgi:putative transposase
MDRLVLSDAAWERMAPLIIGRPEQKGSTGRDNRMFVEGVLWIVRTGSPWRDLPEAFGDWNSVFRRFSRWSLKGVWWGSGNEVRIAGAPNSGDDRGR